MEDAGGSEHGYILYQKVAPTAKTRKKPFGRGGVFSLRTPLLLFDIYV